LTLRWLLSAARAEDELLGKSDYYQTSAVFPNVT